MEPEMTAPNIRRFSNQSSNRLLTSDDYTIIDLNASVIDTPLDYLHVSHAVIYSKSRQFMETGEGEPAKILMQRRVDGTLGFCGGTLEANESLLRGLNRELVEEIALDLTKYRLKLSDHLVSHVSHKQKMVFHFFSKEVTEPGFIEIENNIPNARDWGIEVFGIVRVPLFVKDGRFEGLPFFLGSHFVANSRDQLLYAIGKLQLIPMDYLKPLQLIIQRSN